MKTSSLIQQISCSGLILATATAIAVTATTTQAADFFWNNATIGDWNDGANWDTGDPPTSGTVPSGGGGNFARVNNGGTAELSADMPDIQDPFIGSGIDAVGTLNHSAGTISNATGGWMFVGNEGGIGTYNLSGGTMQKERLYIGRGGGQLLDSTGVLNASDTGEINNTGEVSFGVEAATGNGTFTGNASVTTGLFQVANGSVSITDDVTVNTNGELWVGNGVVNDVPNNAVLDMDSGSIETASWIAVGRNGSTGVMNLSGDASLAKVAGSNDASFVVGTGNGGLGTVNVSESATVTSDTNIVLAENAGSTGIINQSGGTVTVVDKPTTDFNASLHVQGNGTSGTYNLSGGSLNAETIDALDGTFAMTGGVLSAVDFQGDLVQNGGSTSPGDSPGTMTVTGNYSLNSGDLDMEIEGNVAGTGYDQLIVTGDVSLAGELSLSGSYVPLLGESFTLIDNQGANAISGIFTGIVEGSTVTFNGFDLTATYIGGDGNDFVLFSIPEPATLSLLGLSLVMLTGRRRRNQR